jgi:hypothetical protein
LPSPPPPKAPLCAGRCSASGSLLWRALASLGHRSAGQSRAVAAAQLSCGAQLSCQPRCWQHPSISRQPVACPPVLCSPHRLGMLQAALDQESREANRFRRIALIACSVW